ncbi:MAG: hypothetical protein SPL28_03980 [Bacteroidales bacterium]|nr:hypothetical protein [Bacteroidales bacterium]
MISFVILPVKKRSSSCAKAGEDKKTAFLKVRSVIIFSNSSSEKSTSLRMLQDINGIRNTTLSVGKYCILSFLIAMAKVVIY